jgi:hypothetical protein
VNVCLLSKVLAYFPLIWLQGPRLSPKPLNCSNWPPEQVQAWLKSCGCSEAVRVFKDLDIDGAALTGLLRVTDGDAGKLNDVLRHEAGVEKLGLRLRLVEATMKLFGY